MLKLTLMITLATAALTADTVTYKYDDAGRLLSAAYANGAVVTYTYDKAGNLLGRSVPGAGPSISSGGAVNAATFASPLAPGELASLFGANLATATATATNLPLPTSLGGASISVNGVAAPMYYVSPTQINFQVPFEAPISGTAQVVIAQSGAASPPIAVPMAEYAPGIFTYARTPSALDPIIVHAATNAIVTPDNPATANEVLVIYATGAGSFDSPPATGAPASASPLANTKIKAAVTVGGADAAVSFSGLVPGLVGLLQVNVQLPSPLPAGSTLPLVLSFGSASAKSVTLYVK